MSKYNPKFVEDIKEFDPALYTAVSGVSDLAYAEGSALDHKTKHLIALAIDAFDCSAGGVSSLAKKAKAAGASEEEIREAIRMAVYIANMRVVKALSGVLES